jgi:hypothetical protein
MKYSANAKTVKTKSVVRAKKVGKNIQVKLGGVKVNSKES